jgi:hypothetical protein
MPSMHPTQTTGLFSHLQHEPVKVRRDGPFRHPLLKLPGPVRNGRAFFAYAAKRPGRAAADLSVHHSSAVHSPPGRAVCRPNPTAVRAAKTDGNPVLAFGLVAGPLSGQDIQDAVEKFASLVVGGQGNEPSRLETPPPPRSHWHCASIPSGHQQHPALGCQLRTAQRPVARRRVPDSLDQPENPVFRCQ